MIPSGALILLDTNILVHLIRGRAIGRKIVADHDLQDRTEKSLTSIITAGEIHALARKLAWGPAKRRLLDDLLANLVIVHPQQGEIVERYAEIDFYCEKELKPARPMGQNDMWIAASAAALDAYLLTADTDFLRLAPQYLRLVIVDPQTGESRVVSQ